MPQRAAAVGQPALQHQFVRARPVAAERGDAAGQEQRGQRRAQRERGPAQPALGDHLGEHRSGGEREHRQRRHDVDVALALGQREEQHDQHDPGQRQQEARIARAQPRPPARQQARQCQHQRQPARRDHAQVVPGRFVVVPGIGVAAGGLAEQDVVHVGAMLGRIAGVHGQQHRHDPQCDRGQERQCAGQPAPGRAARDQAGPAAPARERERHEHQQRQHADTLGDDAQARREAAEPVRAPVRTEQEVPQQAVVGQRDEERHGRVDLRAFGLVDELERHQQRGRADQSGLCTPQSPARVVDQEQRAERCEQRRQQERDAPVTGQLVGGGLQRHEQRRLVRVQLAAAMRDQPLAALDHLLGDQRETRLVGRPRIAQTHAGGQHDEGDQEEQQQVAARPGIERRQRRGHGTESKNAGVRSRDRTKPPAGPA